MKITLAKALKLKNRLVSKLEQVSSVVSSHNSVLVGQERPIDIAQGMERREKLVDAIINLKTAINLANIPIQSTIYLLSELKGEVSFLRGMDTTSGTQPNHGFYREGSGTLEKTAILGYAEVQKRIEECEANIDANQDIIDKHNYSVEIDVEESIFSLLKG